MDKAIEVNNISKKYNNNPALDDISFDVEKGKVVGLLGPSGSGKSTLIKILTGLVKADSGSFNILGEKLSPDIKKNIIYKADDLIIEEKLRIIDLISLYEHFYPDFSSDESKEILEFLGLDEKRMAMGLSKGQRQKLNLALALASNAEIFLLDEVFDGLDPISTSKAMDLLIDRIDGNKTFLIASQQLELVENLLDEVIFLENGKIHYRDTAINIGKKEEVGISEFYDNIYLGWDYEFFEIWFN